ncbi:TonB-dependent receptor [Cloacibacterium rupense]|uniref:TonB-dependent receptor n=1 Tax=Cloacibacterium rupense TaxID=517423 RepID=A0ABQ2NGI6_9FLAO|nr:TonB-dependent receptor plug domain-containing protein [Cloacibacterium rupense]GGP02778.1 TonB-dependent receptor [Cloacibacterium rupense]
MKLKIFIFSLFFFTFNSIFSQNLKGIYVLNENTKTPISSVLISNSDNSFQKNSDENGFVNLQNFTSENQKIYVSGIGYEKEEFDLDSIKKEKDFGYIFLNPKIVSIAEIQLKNSAKNNIFQTISDLDIHLRPINNSQEILRSVPGLFIGQHAGGGKAEQLFIRGFDVDHGTDVNISVDGIPVNMVSHAHGQGYADLHFVIPEFIDKVNFDKGPYFAEKGNFTTAGFVDFKTKDFLENNFAKLEVGQFKTYRGVLGLNLLKNSKDVKNQSLILATEAYFTDGYFDNPQEFNRFNGMLKYHGKLNDNNFLTAYFSGLSSKWNASGQIPDRAVEDGTIGWFGAIDANEGGKTSRYNFNANLKSYLKNGGKLTNQIYYSKYLFELYSNFTFFLNDPINGDQIRQKEDRNLYGFNSTYEKSTQLFGLKSETIAGIQLRYDDVNDLELSRTKDRNITTEQLKFGDVDEVNLGAFWSQKIALNQNFDITPSIRFDYFNNRYNDKLLNQKLKSNSNIFSPKLRMNYRLNENVQFYSYFGKGFHSNDTRVAVLENGKKVLPPALGTDFGGIFKIGKKLILQSAVWYLWLDQEFVYVGDEAVVEEGGKTERMGIDITARYEIYKNWFADFNLSLAKPRSLGVPSGENLIPLAPKLVSTGGVTYRKETGFNGSLRYRLMGDRPANEDNSVVAKGYFVWDGTVNYTSKNWELGVSVQNIFNVKWKETQFDTESRLYNETSPVSEIHFTPGTPFFSKLSFTYFF